MNVIVFDVPTVIAIVLSSYNDEELTMHPRELGILTQASSALFQHTCSHTSSYRLLRCYDLHLSFHGNGLGLCSSLEQACFSWAFRWSGYFLVSNCASLGGDPDFKELLVDFS